MRRSERAARIGVILDDLFPNPPIPLSHNNQFELLVAVVLSAQCTDERVNQVTPALFAAYPDIPAMSRADVDDVRAIIRPCGLSPSKSKALVGAAIQMMSLHGGAVPSTFEELEALPGVGHKTASVVMSQGFNIPSFPVDTHIHRLAKRWKLSAAKNVVQTERDLKKIFPKDEWNRRHLQIIYFGRKYCPARGHVLEECPICSWV